MFAFNTNAMTVTFTNTEDFTLDFELYNNYHGEWSLINVYSLKSKRSISITIDGLGDINRYGYKVLQSKYDIIWRVANTIVNLYEPYIPLPKYSK